MKSRMVNSELFDEGDLVETGKGRGHIVEQGHVDYFTVHYIDGKWKGLSIPSHYCDIKKVILFE